MNTMREDQEDMHLDYKDRPWVEEMTDNEMLEEIVMNQRKMQDFLEDVIVPAFQAMQNHPMVGMMLKGMKK